MRTKLAALCVVLLALASACADGGDGGDGTTDATPSDGTRAEATDGPEAQGTPNVTRAPEGRVNGPREGAYVYTYSSESTSAATPTASPRRSRPGAQLTSAVKHGGEVITTTEKSTEGPAVATSRTRWEDDRVLELSFETKSSQGTAGCRFETPIEILHIPIKEEKFEPQEFDGTGTSCDGQRTITVRGKENTKDANGTTWSTWRIVVETQVRSPGVTNRSTITRFFSPDLGKDVRTETTSELVNASGGVSARGESTSVLKSYPS